MFQLIIVVLKSPVSLPHSVYLTVMYLYIIWWKL